jgi:transcriptional regulator with XRE-family HTH domain
MHFGERVRELREEQNLTIQQLADRAGLTRNGVSLIELGKRKPGIDTAEALARALNREVGDLFPKVPARS